MKNISFKNNKDLLEKALLIYLGGDSVQPGIIPTGMDDRLRDKFPSEWLSLKEDIDHMLQWLMSIKVDWSKENGTGEVRILLITQFKWLSPFALEKLVNYFTYEWR